jgi:transcriptional regulator with PAS, ATPase and Fis domain
MPAMIIPVIIAPISRIYGLQCEKMPHKNHTAARARGRNGGRPKKLSPKELKTIRKLLRSNEVPVQDIAAQFKVNRSTLYRNVTAT